MAKENDWSSLITRMNAMSNQFTKTDWKIVNYIKKKAEAFLDCNAQELAKAIGTSDASIIRFTQKVGYSGLNEFKYVLQQQIARPAAETGTGDYAALLQDNITLLQLLYQTVKPENVDLLRKKMLAAERIFIVGLEINQHVAEILAFKFAKLGLPIWAVTNYDVLKVYRKISTPRDLFITISLSGEDELLSETLADFINNGSYIVLFSNHEKSLCAAYTDLLFLIPKTDLLSSSNVICREIILLQLGDMIFQNFLVKDSHSYKTFLKTASYAVPDDKDD